MKLEFLMSNSDSVQDYNVDTLKYHFTLHMDNASNTILIRSNTNC